MNNFGRYVYILAIMLIAFPFQAFGISDFITPALALFAGLVFALIRKARNIFFRLRWSDLDSA